MVLGIAATLELHDSQEVLLAAPDDASTQVPSCLGACTAARRAPNGALFCLFV